MDQMTANNGNVSRLDLGSVLIPTVEEVQASNLSRTGMCSGGEKIRLMVFSEGSAFLSDRWGTQKRLLSAMPEDFVGGPAEPPKNFMRHTFKLDCGSELDLVIVRDLNPAKLVWQYSWLVDKLAMVLAETNAKRRN